MITIILTVLQRQNHFSNQMLRFNFALLHAGYTLRLHMLFTRSIVPEYSTTKRLNELRSFHRPLSTILHPCTLSWNFYCFLSAASRCHFITF